MQEIQDCAEKVVAALSRVARLNILLLAETIDERSILIYQALGWLACKGRVRYTQNGSRIFVSLVERMAKNSTAPDHRGEK